MCLAGPFYEDLIGTGEEREGVYYFTGVKAACVHRNEYKNASTSGLWDRRLGHPSFCVLSSLPILDKMCFDSEQEKSCEICFRAKQTRSSFPESLNKATAPFVLIHCDVWGPY